MSESVPRTQPAPGVAGGRSAEGPAEWQPGDVILDLYEVTALLGEGGMGKVHKVRHRGWELDLVVKSPKLEVFAGPRGRDDFAREAETWVGMGLHPQVVTCHYVRRLGGIPRVFAEFVDGGSLSDWIHSGKLYEGGPERALPRILDVAIQFAWGLGYAHERGFVHQDVKPANLMMTSAGDAKVTDFGLARARMVAGVALAGEPGHGLVVTTRGMTPAYCSPEQARGEPVSRATDFWSWALSVLEMFTGEVTWAAGPAGAEALRDCVESGGGPASVPRMPRAVAELLGRCLQAAPNARRSRMEEVAEELRAIHRELAGADHERSPPRPATLQADGLNNRALSYLDLGRAAEAGDSWRAALGHDALHPEALYNSLVWRWRQAEIDDEELLRGLAVLRGRSTLALRAALVTALAHLERGDRDSVAAVLEPLGAGGGEEARAVLRRARSGDLGSGRPAAVLEGHRGSVTAVCLGADGRTAVTGGADATVRAWDLAGGRAVSTCRGHHGPVTSLALAADGRRAVSGSQDGTVRLWDLSRRPWRWLPRISRDPRLSWNHAARTLRGHDSAVTCVSVSPDGRWALSGSPDGSVRLWDLEGGRCLRVLSHGPVLAVWLAADGRRAASADAAAIRLWDLASGRCDRTLELPRPRGKDAISSCRVAFSPDGRWAASNDPFAFTGRMSIWGLERGETGVLQADRWQSYRACFSTSGRRLLSLDASRALRIWDVESGRCRATFRLPAGADTWVELVSIAVGPDGRTALAGGPDGGARLWPLPREDARMDSFQPSTPWSHAGLSDVTGRARRLRQGARSALGEGRIADAHRHLVEARSLPGQERTVENVTAWTELAGACRRRRVQGRWRVTRLEAPGVGPVTTAHLGRDGRWAASGHGDGAVWLWDTLGGTWRQVLGGHLEGVRSISASHDERWLLTLSPDSLRLWERESGECRRVIARPAEHSKWSTWFRGAGISPDGAWAASAGPGPVRIWELSSGRCVRELPGSGGDQVAWTPDGRRLVTAYHLLNSGGRRWLQVWDVAAGRCLRTVKKYCRPFGLSADGRFVAATRRHWGAGDTSRSTA